MTTIASSSPLFLLSSADVMLHFFHFPSFGSSAKPFIYPQGFELQATSQVCLTFDTVYNL